MLAGLERADRDIAMEAGRQADVDRLDVPIGQQGVDRPVDTGVSPAEPLRDAPRARGRGPS